MRRIAFQLLAILCALYVSGAHWCALQTLAWTGMLVSRAQTATVSEAVRTTFDGDHPCALCQAVNEGQQRENENDTARLAEALAKLSFLRPPSVVVPAPTAVAFDFEVRVTLVCPRVDTPPSPPPTLA